MPRNQLLFVTFLLIVLLALAQVASAQGARFSETFINQSAGANGQGCNANGWCGFLGITQGQSAPENTISTFIFYDMLKVVGDTTYDLSGYGDVPSSDVMISGLGSVSLNVDTSKVSGFSSQLCSFDSSTGASACTNDFPIVTLDLKSNGAFRTHGTTVDTSAFFRNTFMFEGTFNGQSASGSMGIADQSFSNASGAITQGQNVQVSVF